MAQTGVVTVLEVALGPSGSKNGRAWQIHKIKASDGNTYDTFQAPLAQQARDTNGAPVVLEYDIRISNRDGTEYTNYDLKGVSPANGNAPVPQVATVAQVEALAQPAPSVAPSDFAQKKDAKITRLSAASTAFQYAAAAGLGNDETFALADRIEYFANHGLTVPAVAVAPQPVAAGNALPWDDAA